MVDVSDIAVDGMYLQPPSDAEVTGHADRCGAELTFVVTTQQCVRYLVETISAGEFVLFNGVSYRICSEPSITQLSYEPARKVVVPVKRKFMDGQGCVIYWMEDTILEIPERTEQGVTVQLARVGHAAGYSVSYERVG